MEQSPEQQKDHSFWIGIFLGGLLGAIIIVLLGTEKGKKLAHKLQTDGLDFLDDKIEPYKENLSEIQQKGRELIEKGQELVTEGRDLEEKVIETAAVAKDQFMSQAAVHADETLAHIERLQEQGREATAQMRRRLFKNIPRRTS